MERKSFAAMHCSVAQCLEVVGEWWTMLIVRDAFWGVRRFEDFTSRLGISRNVLAQRLAHLVDLGVLAKVPYSEHPPRHEYRLTDKGRALWPVLTAMRQWGDTWAAPDGPPVVVEHRACGAAVGAVMTCAGCGERLGPRDVRLRPGPGDRDELFATTDAAVPYGG
ncbi:MAG: winged helix-turn-helix transcriptional regulator [Acidimicrobiales bacterium]